MTDLGAVVSNSGPLIGLGEIKRLDLLEALYGEVLVPSEVYREVTITGQGRPGAAEVKAAAFIRELSLSVPVPAELAAQLGPGEAEAITLAIDLRARWLLLDERQARGIAGRDYPKLRVRGTAGVLCEAKRAGVLPAIKPLLQALLAANYRISTAVLERACLDAGEVWP